MVKGQQERIELVTRPAIMVTSNEPDTMSVASGGKWRREAPAAEEADGPVAAALVLGMGSPPPLAFLWSPDGPGFEG